MMRTREPQKVARTTRRIAGTLAMLVTAGLLTGCQDLLSQRYGFPVEYSDPATAPHAGDACESALAGTGNVDPAGRVLQCKPEGQGFAWHTVTERSDATPTVLIFGDSIIEESQEAITAALGPGWNTVYRVFGGTAPCDWTQWAARDIRAFRPTVVVTSFIGNNMTPCMQSNGSGLAGPALAEKYRQDLTILANAALVGGAKVIITSSPIPSNPLFVDSSGLAQTGSWAAAHALAALGKAVWASDDGKVLLDPAALPGKRVGAQWLPCRADGSEADVCVGGMVQVRTPMPDGVHLCPTLAPRPYPSGCAVRNVGAERYAAAMAATIVAVRADAPLPIPAPPRATPGHSRDFHSGPAARLLDTRATGTTVDGRFQRIGAPAAGSVTTVQVAGRGGVPADAVAVTVNLTVVPVPGRVPTPGYLSAYNCAAGRPATSVLNFSGSTAVANGATVPLGDEGTICIFASASTDVVIDTVGWFMAGSTYRAAGPWRMMDTRPGGTTFDGRFRAVGTRVAGSTTEVQISGRGGVPADADAVVINLTATGAAGSGHMTVHTCGATEPPTSNLNLSLGSTVANNTITALSNRGTICVSTSVASHFLLDVVGWLGADSSYRALTPTRLLDSRPSGSTVDSRFSRTGQRSAGTTIELAVIGRGGVPANAAAVAVNITATGATANGYVTVYRCDARPATSTLNTARGVTVANGVVIELSDNGTLCLFTSSATHLIVDVSGWFAPSIA